MMLNLMILLFPTTLYAESLHGRSINLEDKVASFCSWKNDFSLQKYF